MHSVLKKAAITLEKWIIFSDFTSLMLRRLQHKFSGIVHGIKSGLTINE
jgi:hypothetical protein